MCVRFAPPHLCVYISSYSKGGKASANEVSTVKSVHSETATTAFSSRRNKASRGGSFKPSSSAYSQLPETNGYTRRTYQKKPAPTPVESEQTDGGASSLYKFKLNRQPGRWQYKTTPKPRVTIRKQTQNELVKEEAANIVTPSGPVFDSLEGLDDGDLDQSGSLINGDVLNADEEDNRIDRRFPIETLKVEISTPADFKDTYFEIATIKSPYTFQVRSFTENSLIF